MPRNQFQRIVFAVLTVLITVHAYVFYSLYVINGSILMQVNNASSVLHAIHAQGGIYTLGRYLPIWAVILIEFCLAVILEITIGSPCSFQLASKVFDPRKNHPMLFETAVICATVGIMCPVMSFIAAWLYYPYYEGLQILTLMANWIKLICFNFPFAYFTQLFFIQPFVRTVFKLLFRKDIAAREAKHHEVKPTSETEAIEDVIVREREIRNDSKTATRL